MQSRSDYGPGAAGTTGSAAVQAALDRYAVIAGDSDVTVTASDGAIALTGHVRTWAEHDAVLDAAWMGMGVSGVRDDLVVSG